MNPILPTNPSSPVTFKRKATWEGIRLEHYRLPAGELPDLRSVVGTPRAEIGFKILGGRRIIKLISVAGAVVDSDRVITAAINGTSITGGAITLTASGSAAGDVVSVTPTALNLVNEDDKISFASDGAGSTSCPHHFFAVVARA